MEVRQRIYLEIWNWKLSNISGRVHFEKILKQCEEHDYQFKGRRIDTTEDDTKLFELANARLQNAYLSDAIPAAVVYEKLGIKGEDLAGKDEVEIE